MQPGNNKIECADASKQVAALEQQIAEQKAESHTSLQSARSELTTALQAHTAAEARAVQAEAQVSTKSESLTETRGEITLLKGHISDLEGKLATAQQAITTATEQHHIKERELHSTHSNDLEAAKREAAAVHLQEIAAVIDRAAASEKSLREEHTREVIIVSLSSLLCEQSVHLETVLIGLHVCSTP